MEHYLKQHPKSQPSVADTETAPKEADATTTATHASIKNSDVLAAIQALGGAENIHSAKSCALTRIRVELEQGIDPDTKALKQAGITEAMRCSDTIIHLLVGEQHTSAWEQAFNEHLKVAIA